MSSQPQPASKNTDAIIQAILAAHMRGVTPDRVLKAINSLNAPSDRRMYPPMPLLPVPEPDLKTADGGECYSREKLTKHSQAVFRMMQEHFEHPRPLVIGDHVHEATNCAERADFALEEFAYLSELRPLDQLTDAGGLIKLVRQVDSLYRRTILTAQLGGVEDYELAQHCAFSEHTLLGFRLHDAMNRPVDFNTETAASEEHPYTPPSTALYEPGTF